MNTTKTRGTLIALLLTLIGSLCFLSCGGASGPEDEVVKQQVTECLNSLQPTDGFSFPDYFEVQTVVVKDRMVKVDSCEVVVDFTVQLKRAASNDSMILFGSLVRQNGNAGDIVTNPLTVTFKRFEKGWRIDCTTVGQ